MNHISKLRSSVNPYLASLLNIWERIKWDINRHSWNSRRQLRGLQNTMTTKKAVILCNGPSLNKVDFEALQNSDVFVIGLNKINLLFDRTDFRPDAIVSVNKFVIEQNKDFFNETEIPLFLGHNSMGTVLNRDLVTWLHMCDRLRFARDCSCSVVTGFTVTYVALQLAFHIGFKSVALVGCDHNFHSKGQANKIIKAEESDRDHFDPRYFSSGVNWQLPDISGSEFFYTLAREHYSAFNRTIYNCTVGGALDVYPRMKLGDFLA